MANSVAAKREGFGKRMSRFLRESWIEVVKKASWPTWAELKKSTTVVIVAVIVIAAYLGLWDFLLGKLSTPLFGPTLRK